MDQQRNGIKYSAENHSAQYFSIPKTVLYYILNSYQISPTLFYKLYFSCKFFYNKLKVIPCYMTRIELQTSYLLYNGELVKVSPEVLLKLDLKFYIFSQFLIHNEFPSNTVSNFNADKIWKCDIEVFHARHQNLTKKEYQLLTSSVECIVLINVTVRQNDGNVVKFEELLRLIPTAFQITFEASTEEAFTSQTAQNISKLNRTIKINSFSLGNVFSNFDAKSFANFIKENANCKRKYGKSWFHLEFDNSVDVETKYNFKTTVLNEITKFEPKEKAPSFLIMNE